MDIPEILWCYDHPLPSPNCILKATRLSSDPTGKIGNVPNSISIVDQYYWVPHPSPHFKIPPMKYMQ